MQGLTMVEALLCVAILGVLASTAAAPLRAALLKQRVAAVKTELTTALQWARWEALRRNTSVTLLRRTDCAALLPHVDDWHCGWQVVEGAVSDSEAAIPDARILQQFDLPAGLRLVHAGGGAALRIARSGYPTHVAHKFILGLPTGTASGVSQAQPVTALCINRTGRVRAVEGQTTC